MLATLIAHQALDQIQLPLVSNFLREFFLQGGEQGPVSSAACEKGFRVSAAGTRASPNAPRRPLRAPAL